MECKKCDRVLYAEVGECTKEMKIFVGIGYIFLVEFTFRNNKTKKAYEADKDGYITITDYTIPLQGNKFLIKVFTTKNEKVCLIDCCTGEYDRIELTVINSSQNYVLVHKCTKTFRNCVGAKKVETKYCYNSKPAQVLCAITL